MAPALRNGRVWLFQKLNLNVMLYFKVVILNTSSLFTETAPDEERSGLAVSKAESGYYAAF